MLNPDERATGQFVEERNQIIRGEMNAAVRRRTAQRRFVASAVNVNVTIMRIYIAAAIEAGFKSFEPQNARGDFSE